MHVMLNQGRCYRQLQIRAIFVNFLVLSRKSEKCLIISSCPSVHSSVRFKLVSIIQISLKLCIRGGPGGVVSITTVDGLDSQRIESRWGRDIPQLSKPALGPIQPLLKLVPGLSRGQKGAGAHRPLTAFQCHGQERVELYLYTPMGRTACTEPKCLSGVYFTFFFYSGLSVKSVLKIRICLKTQKNINILFMKTNILFLRAV